jgi:predicted nucleic acid-binding protein
VVAAELQTPSVEMLVSRGLMVRELAGEQVLKVAQLTTLYRRPSTPDLFALVLARSLGIALLTGDRHLREAAQREGVVVHGTLWLLDRMVELGVLTCAAAAHALDRMIASGSRFPPVETQDRLRRWRSDR